MSEPIFSVSDTEGIRINVRPGDRVEMNGDHIRMTGVSQHVAGGTIQHRASAELIQKNNVMMAESGGLIVNEVSSKGVLRQEGNHMVARESGSIINRTAKKIGMPGVIGITAMAVGFTADMITLFISGKHLFW